MKKYKVFYNNKTTHVNRDRQLKGVIDSRGFNTVATSILTHGLLSGAKSGKLFLSDVKDSGLLVINKGDYSIAYTIDNVTGEIEIGEKREVV